MSQAVTKVLRGRIESNALKHKPSTCAGGPGAVGSHPPFQGNPLLDGISAAGKEISAAQYAVGVRPELRRRWLTT